MRRIVIDCRMYFSSGIGRYLQNIVLHLLQKTKEYEVILLGNEDSIKKQLVASGVLASEINIINFDVPIYTIKEQLKLPFVIPESDIFWSPHFNIPLLPIKSKRRIVTIHDAYHLAFLNQLTFKEKIYAKIMYNSALRKSDRVITVSDFSKKELLKYSNFSKPEKIEVIHNGVAEISLEGNNFHNPEYIPYLLSVGNLKPNKNFINALLGFSKFLQENRDSNLKFIIIGKKEGFVNGDNRIDDLMNKYSYLQDKVYFTGHVSDQELAVLYQNATAFIFPSIYEGFGLPPLEAMLYNVPVLCSNAASMPEICGDSVLYFNPIDPDDIARSIVQISTDDILSEELQKKGKERSSQFTWELSAKKHFSIIDELFSS
ncbi:glycosyltransferase family 1 protein [Chryseobacterium sp. KACC 21268]|nr:glycosyltransferase family 1 protein [Chryseobacterium sp. KACC 21268]